ncbi:MAG: hypothetical protein M3N16_01115 [Actinomycetota bacterium]|nr:hypothetical protein [Actinomycetota bacterium]
MGESLGKAVSIPGWTGTASFQYANRCVPHRDVIRSAESVLDAAARTLSELAEELQRAIREAEAAVATARKADERRRAAEEAAAAARTHAEASRERGEGLARQADAREAAGHPAPEARFDSEQAFQEGRAASEAAAQAETRARRAAEELDEARREGRLAVERYRRYGDQAAHVIGALAGVAPAVVLPAPPPQAATGSDTEGGNALDGLVKGLGDLKDEAVGLAGGAVNHVNVFNPDKLTETWSRDYQIGKAVVTDPIGSAKQVWEGTTAPLREAYRTGGRDEAGARAVPALLGAVLGGKGLTKLGKAGDVGRQRPDVPPVKPGRQSRPALPRQGGPLRNRPQPSL